MPGDPKLGARIRTARTTRGWKQKHLAAHVSVEPITVSRWERGATTPDLDALGAVAEATGKPLSFFVEDADPSAGAPGPSETTTARIEAAAAQISEEVGELATVLAELRDELRALRARS